MICGYSVIGWDEVRVWQMMEVQNGSEASPAHGWIQCPSFTRSSRWRKDCLFRCTIPRRPRRNSRTSWCPPRSPLDSRSTCSKLSPYLPWSISHRDVRYPQSRYCCCRRSRLPQWTKRCSCSPPGGALCAAAAADGGVWLASGVGGRPQWASGGCDYSPCSNTSRECLWSCDRSTYYYQAASWSSLANWASVRLSRPRRCRGCRRRLEYCPQCCSCFLPQRCSYSSHCRPGSSVCWPSSGGAPVLPGSSAVASGPPPGAAKVVEEVVVVVCAVLGAAVVVVVVAAWLSHTSLKDTKKKQHKQKFSTSKKLVKPSNFVQTKWCWLLVSIKFYATS